MLGRCNKVASEYSSCTALDHTEIDGPISESVSRPLPTILHCSGQPHDLPNKVFNVSHVATVVRKESEASLPRTFLREPNFNSELKK